MRRRVEPRMVGPLVGDAQRHAGDGHLAVADVAEAVRVLLARVLLAFRQVVAQMQVLPRLQFADRILREHDHAERADRLGDAVVDLGVDVVRASGEHDAPAVVLLHVGERLETFLLHVVLEDLVLGVRGLDRGLGLLAAHVRPGELLDDAVDHELVVGEVEVRVHVADAVLAQFGHVRADHHRVVGHDRAVVVVVRIGHEVVLVAHARVEDVLDALAQQPLDVAVHQLGRVADVLGGDRFDAGLEQLVRAAAGDHHLEAERGEQREPERVVLVHVEHARDADLAAGGLLVGEPAVGEAALVLVVVQVRPVGALLLRVAAALAAVAGNVARAVGERGDGELAVVLAQLAHVALGGHRHVVEVVAGQDVGRRVVHAVDDDLVVLLRADIVAAGHIGGLALGDFGVVVVRVVGHVLVMHARGQGGAERAHQTGDVRAGHLALGEQLEGAQHGVIEERAALHDDGVAELTGVTQLDDLVQRVAHDRIAQAGGDVLHRRAFLLCLLDGRVHEHRAARAEVDRMVGVEGRLGELLDGQTHRLREGLQERAATGRARLVDGDRVDDAVGDGQVFHVLATDVDDSGDAGADHFGAAVVRHGLDHALVQVQAGGDQSLAVAGRAGSGDPRAFGQLGLDLLDDVDGGGQRAAFVVGVAGPDDFTVVVDERGLDGGGTSVDAQEVRAVRAFKGADVDVFLVVALVEVLAIGLGGEQRRHGGRVGGQVLQLVQTLQDFVAGVGLEMVALIVGIRVGLQCRTVGHIQVGVGRHDELVDLAFKGTLEGGAQFGHEEQRAAEEDDGTVDRAARSQAGDGLRGHCGENRGGEIRLGRAVVDQRLQIGFGEHAATRGDRIQVLVALGHLVEACGVGVKQRGHLVDERAGAACARTIHTLFGRGLQVGDLGVLAAELDDDVGLRVFLVDRAGLGDDLLDERHVQVVGERQAAGTGDGETNGLVAAAEVDERLMDVLEQSSHRGADVGVVTSVVGEQHVIERIGLIEHHGLDRGRSDIQTHAQRLTIVAFGRGIRCIHHLLPLSSVRDFPLLPYVM